MKSVKKERLPESVPEFLSYPCLGVSKITGNVILFTGASQGILVYVPDCCHPIGTGYKQLNMINFKEFKGDITLSQ